MNLEQIRRLVITQARSRGATLSDLDYPMINELINRGVEEIAYDTTLLVKSASISTASAIEMYKLPADCVRVQRVDLASETAMHRNILNVADINIANASDSPGWA